MTYAEQLKANYQKSQNSRQTIEYAKTKIQAACDQACRPGRDPVVGVAIDNLYNLSVLEIALKELGFPEDSYSVDTDYLDNPLCTIDLRKL